MNYSKEVKQQVFILRKQGKTYLQINQILGINIPKSTLSGWFKGLILSPDIKKELFRKKLLNINNVRQIALETNKLLRNRYLDSITARISHLAPLADNINIAKIVLAMLYLGEGSKSTGFVVFGNSNPRIVKLFLYLLRKCYSINESKFRCTVQLRADQDIEKLEQFWLDITGISKTQFYKARVDSRTIGKTTKNKDYKGVCRIDYFSAEVFWELTKISDSICGLVA